MITVNKTKNITSSFTDIIIDAKNISQSFTSNTGTIQHVLRDISFTLHEGEIVAILGRSGTGKSTLLRTMAGLIQPTKGTVTYRGCELTGPNPGVAIVFQTFALLPWLTVQDNVELGLRARGIKKEKRTQLALEAIDAIGLDGFETAYPKELSGGMRQRVGIARALVLRPDALFMDEPFSALDVLTAENLRQEVLKLWSSKKRDIKSVLIVTHNIEEAVQMADRVVVLGSHPGHLIANIKIDLPRPRDKHSIEFGEVVDNLYAILTGSITEKINKKDNYIDVNNSKNHINNGENVKYKEAKIIADMLIQHNYSTENSSATNNNLLKGKQTVSMRLLPNATPGGMAGLLDIISETPEGIDLSDLAANLSFEIDDLFPLIDAACMLNLITAENGRITITEVGKQWHNADILSSKQFFAKLSLEHAPLVRAIDQALSRNSNGKLRGELILDLLRSKHNDTLAKQQFNIAISWGRYGELFDYDADDDELTRTVETTSISSNIK